jgi:hypothetical protein
MGQRTSKRFRARPPFCTGAVEGAARPVDGPLPGGDEAAQGVDALVERIEVGVALTIPIEWKHVFVARGLLGTVANGDFPHYPPSRTRSTG